MIGNCLKCGRIVCEQEGSGPCYFCANLVCTREEMEKISRGSNKGQKLKQDLLSRNWNAFEKIAQSLTVQSNQTDEENFRKAVEHKNKLIDFDRTSAKRTQVIDDESDYFDTNSKWLSQQQKVLLDKKEQEFRNKRFGSKLDNKKFTIDFAGRKVVDEQEILNLSDVGHEIDNIMKYNETLSNSEQAGAIINFNLDSIQLKFVEEKNKKLTKKNVQSDTSQNKNANYRIQNPELQEMKDDGMCLSMHQPWASLLVAGIKKYFLKIKRKQLRKIKYLFKT